MSVIVTIAIPSEAFTLGAALTDERVADVRLEQVIPLGKSSIPYLWAADGDIEELEAALEAEADIDEFRIVDRVAGDALVRITWAETVDGFLEALGDTGGVILEGVGGTDRWRFQLRFDEHTDLREFYEQCTDKAVPLQILSLHNPGFEGTDAIISTLTDDQTATLQLAYRRGYFDVPRRTNLVQLADELDISDTAVSQRLRRGLSELLESAVAEELLEDEE